MLRQIIKFNSFETVEFFTYNSSKASTNVRAKLRTMSQKKRGYSKTVMRSVTLVGIVAPVLLMFAGCASLSKAQCLEGDWYEIGLSDGESGVESDRFNGYVDTCAKYGVVPDFAKYSEGRTKGLEFFCTRSNGYSEGRQGRVYRKVCSGASEQLFLEGHSLGYAVHSTEEFIEDLDSKIREKYKQIEIWETQVDEILDLSLAGANERERNADERQELNDQGADRQSDITEAKMQIKELQDSKAEAMTEYRNAIDEANENGFQEEATIEFPEVGDDGKLKGATP